MCEFPLVLAYPLGGCVDLSIFSIELISSTLIKIGYNTDVILDSNYYDITNYNITGTQATIKAVLPVYETAGTAATSTNYTLLRVNPLLPGSTYTVGATNLTSINGSNVNGSTKSLTAHSTKTDSALMTLPSHFDKRPGSVVFGVLSAISRSDELIGGAFTSPIEVTDD